MAEIRVELLERIRGERRFASVEELRRQIERDKALFGSNDGPAPRHAGRSSLRRRGVRCPNEIENNSNND